VPIFLKDCFLWHGTTQPCHAFWHGTTQPCHAFWHGTTQPCHARVLTTNLHTSDASNICTQFYPLWYCVQKKAFCYYISGTVKSWCRCHLLLWCGLAYFLSSFNQKQNQLTSALTFSSNISSHLFVCILFCRSHHHITNGKNALSWCTFILTFVDEIVDVSSNACSNLRRN